MQSKVMRQSDTIQLTVPHYTLLCGRDKRDKLCASRVTGGWGGGGSKTGEGGKGGGLGEGLTLGLPGLAGSSGNCSMTGFQRRLRP